MKKSLILFIVILIISSPLWAVNPTLGTGCSADHSISIHKNGTVYTWGNNENGQLGDNSTSNSDVPVAVDMSGVLSGKSITAVASGRAHSVALASDGTLYAWGDNAYGQLGDNSTTDRHVPVAVDMSGVLSGKKITSIVAGTYHTMAIASDGMIYAWGDNYYGQLGNNSTTYSPIPVAVDMSGVLSGKTIQTLAAGYGHSIVLASDGTVYAWGRNNLGQLGDNSTIQRNTPVAVDMSGVLFGKTISAIVAGANHSIALATDGLIYAWGFNANGQLGDNSTTQRNTPVAVDMSGVLSGKMIRTLSAGFSHSVALATDGLVYAWGYNANGQLGDNSTTQRNTPVAVDMNGLLSGKMITAVATGYSHSLALSSEGTVYAWGSNVYGQLGDNSTVNADVPVQVVNSNNSEFILWDTKISTGCNAFHTISIRDNGTAFAWGRNTYGQLGNNSITDSHVPVQVYMNGVLFGKKIREVSTGDEHSVALTSDGMVYAWGRNAYGQLGDNSTTDSHIPIAVNMGGVLSGKTIIAVAAGNRFSLALASDGTVYTWGYNVYGQLGNNSTTDSHIPVAVDMSGVLSGKTIMAVAVGAYHSLALASDGMVYAWGWNIQGQLGDNSTTNRQVPIAVNMSGVLNGKTITTVTAGYSHSMALASDNTLYAWGYNSKGQLGDNSTTDRHIPVAVDMSGVLSGKTITTAVAGYNHTTASASDGTIYTWGWNIQGQLGDNSTTDRQVPIAVNMSGLLSGKTITEIVAGIQHSTGLASDGTVYAWGDNYYGELGNNNSPTDSHVPVLVVNSDKNDFDLWISNAGLSTGCYASHTIATNDEGSVYAWGENDEGQIGDNSTTDRQVPVAVNMSGAMSGKMIIAQASGSYHSLVLASDGTLYAWGDNAYGQLGNNSITDSSIPVAVDMSGVLSGKTITAVAAGERHSLVLALDGCVYAWGDNSQGQLGDNSITDSHVPVAVDMSGVLSGKTITAITAGRLHSMTLASDGSVCSWGWNAFGQLGNNSTTKSPIPVAVDISGVLSGKTITLISAGFEYSAVLATDGLLYTWGHNPNGELGNNSIIDSHVPVAVDISGVLSGKTITAVAAGTYHSLAMASDGTLYTWGYNYFGELGNNSTTDSQVPVAVDMSGVLSDKTIIDIVVGNGHSVVLASDNTVYTWGWNYYGQLGINSTTDSHIPVQVINSDNSEFALPIELGDFTANYSKGAVNISWQTATETDNARFLIYRNDEVIGSIEGASTTSELHEYTFTDNTVVPGTSYTYVLADVSYANLEVKHIDKAVTILIPENDIPQEFALEANYPNPFNPRTAINFQLSMISNVELSIYDMSGKKIATLINDNKPAGYYELTWDASDFSSGIYFYRLQAGDFVDTKKMVFMK